MDIHMVKWSYNQPDPSEDLGVSHIDPLRNGKEPPNQMNRRETSLHRNLSTKCYLPIANAPHVLLEITLWKQFFSSEEETMGSSVLGNTSFDLMLGTILSAISW